IRFSLRVWSPLSRGGLTSNTAACTLKAMRRARKRGDGGRPARRRSAKLPASRETDQSVTGHAAKLRYIAAQVRAEHGEAITAARDYLEHAFAVGRLLIEAKEILPLGELLLWLRSTCSFFKSVRPAQDYMRLAEAEPMLRQRLKSNPQRAVHLSIRGLA